ncbi:MAG: ABC transporter ATP-binding protein [Candidatus Eisenbacteria bacterium]|uniref:ABC transporter ATP-binding protein n=1 Tax=Eiseniibacteriota bacterium TaxID=2212470 RepID=A0A948RY45_UNCEI|nr:ABC transporter ATP-binding protein [Candidatus Eisenbacteria bacterium]MBU1950088.1 ABC transporter ATP-binding protein [Candidatus Eisenbacteria bacterium]MBU2693170.1 ABC transporter ATP-binding protein [Candidatus Eisenbacteria bacterium]
MTGSANHTSIRPPLLEATELCRYYGTVRAVHQLSLSIFPGQIVGLLGPNGAGKTTTLRMLVGSQVPSQGRVMISGYDVFRQGPQAKKFLGYLPENPGMAREMDVISYLEFVARLKGMKGYEIGPSVQNAVKIWNLREVARRPVAQLSRGFRQRTGLAQATLNNPPLLILDEPTTGLDPNQAADLRGTLRRHAATGAVLISTHLLAEATSLCDQLVILHRGEVVAQGDRQILTQRVADSGSLRAVIRGGARLAEIARRRGLKITAKGEGDPDHEWILEGTLPEQDRDVLLQELIAAKGELVEWTAGGRTLEDLFRQLTQEGKP